MKNNCLYLIVVVWSATVLAAEKPNIIVFLTDDQGYNDVGCYGSPDIKTPNFDRMATEGMLFTSAYVGSPVCGPSRSALMTGSYPIRIGEPGNRKALHTIPHTKEVMIPEVLKPAGYQSALLGKWHAGQAKTQGDPLSQGFDYFFGTPRFNGFTKYINQTKVRAELIRNREVVVKGIDGKDLMPLLTGVTQESPHEYYYYYCYTGLQAVRDARWKLVLPRSGKPKWMGWWARMIDEVKTIELYDLKADIGETVNVVAKHPEVVDRLMKQVEQARAELGDAGTIGSGARFFDPGKRRPDIANYRNEQKK